MDQIEDLYAGVPDARCRGLCVRSGACGSVGMTELEQRRIAERGVDLPLKAAFAGDCPALRDGSCSVYEVRPLVCRLYGAVEGMRCPYGCTPQGGRLPDAEGRRLLGRMRVLSRRAMQGGGGRTS